MVTVRWDFHCDRPLVFVKFGKYRDLPLENRWYRPVGDACDKVLL